jgi:murein DD-endopeptidase MepM/ murein hydrolase activator NlpD
MLVLKHLKGGVSVILAPHTTGTTVTFNLPGRLAVLLLVLMIVFIAGLAFVGITYTRLAVLALETTRLRAENRSLREENSRIAEIEYEMSRIADARRAIETWAGILPDSTDVRREAERRIEDNLMPLTWPRNYSYDLMRGFHLMRGGGPYGMVLPVEGWVSRGFLTDENGETLHPGVDIAAPVGTPVRCALDGVVTLAGWDDIFGNLVVVQHNDSTSTAYGHNEELLVKEGDYVARGQVIATVGNTGRSTAPHLHFEILRDQVAVDPARYVQFKSNE